MKKNGSRRIKSNTPNIRQKQERRKKNEFTNNVAEH